MSITVQFSDSGEPMKAIADDDVFEINGGRVSFVRNRRDKDADEPDAESVNRVLKLRFIDGVSE